MNKVNLLDLCKRKVSYFFMLSLTAWIFLPNVASAFEPYLARRDFSKPQGSTWSTAITIDRYGVTAPIQVTAMPPAGSGISAVVTPANPLIGSRGTLTFTLSPTAPVGDRNFNVRFTGGGITKYQSVEILVTAARTGTGGTSGSGGSGGVSGSGGSGGISGSGGSGGTGGSGSTGGSGGTGSTGGTGGTGGTPVVSSFSVSTSPTTSVQQGQSSAAIPVSISRTNFTSSVALSLTGAPVGVTASFNPASTTGNSSSMTLTVASGVGVSTYSMTVRAISGSTTQTAPIALTVTAQPANFTMTAPSSVSIQQSQTATMAINLSRTNLTSSVSFTLTGLPSGITSSCPATTGSSTTCAFTASSSAATGSSTLNVDATGGGITRTANISMNVTAAPITPTGLRAFPEAEGFGATTTNGGRGGVVCKVTNLNNSGAGSLQACMDLSEPAYIVFTVSGVIDSSLECHTGNKTVAGQTSPAGIITRGMIFDDVYEANPLCSNVILRHLRSRPAAGERSASGYVNDDSIRLDGAKNMVIDHVSFERASDEAFQLSRSNNIIVQNSVFAETPPEHYWGGMLINYSTTAHNQDNLSIHHNLWTGIQARFPEISCEENGDDRLGTSNCTNKHMKLELSNNMIYDPSDPIWYNRCTGNNAGNDCAASGASFFVDMNWIGNYMRDRTGSDNAFINGDLLADSRNHVYYTDNFFDAGLASLFNFSVLSTSSPFLYPQITYTQGSDIPNYMVGHVGAFPRDPMDQRLVGYISQNINTTPLATNTTARGKDTFYLLTPACAAPADTDNDGMPDVWETRHGLIVGADDHNGTQLSTDGYPNIEVYLNELSNQVVARGSATTALCDIASW